MIPKKSRARLGVCFLSPRALQRLDFAVTNSVRPGVTSSLMTGIEGQSPPAMQEAAGRIGNRTRVLKLEVMVHGSPLLGHFALLQWSAQRGGLSRCLLPLSLCQADHKLAHGLKNTRFVLACTPSEWDVHRELGKKWAIYQSDSFFHPQWMR